MYALCFDGGRVKDKEMEKNKLDLECNVLWFTKQFSVSKALLSACGMHLSLYYKTEEKRGFNSYSLQRSNLCYR